MKPEESSKQQLLDWAQEIRAVCEQENDSPAVEMIDSAVSAFRADKFVISVMGLAKRGKSTLINALLGRSDDMLAPIDKLPATSCTTSFSCGKEFTAEAVFRDGSSVQIAPQEIRSYATEEENPENKKSVQLLRVVGPFDSRLNDVTLVDLPGVGSIHGHHDQIVHQFLPQSDAVILLTTARMPINEQELDMLKEVRGAKIDNLFVAVNKADTTDEDELAECVEHNRRQLNSIGVSVPAMRKISAKNAYEGKWSGSGVDELWADVEDFLRRERGKVAKRRFYARILEAASPVLEGLRARTFAAGKSAEELAATRARLSKEKKNLEKSREMAEDRFESEWNAAVDDAESRLPQIERSVAGKIAAKISSSGIISVGGLEKSLPGFFNKTLESELLPVFGEMERRFRDLTEEFETRYPAVCTDAGGTPSIRTEFDTTVVKGAALGTALAGSGALASTIIGGLTTTAVSTAPAYTGFLGAIFGFVGFNSTVTTASTVPAAIAAFAGPIGWTLAGLGGAAVAVSWGISKARKKNNLQDIMDENVRRTFSALRNERIPQFRKLVKSLIREYRLNLDRRIAAVEEALEDAERNAADPRIAKKDEASFRRLQLLVDGTDDKE